MVKSKFVQANPTDIFQGNIVYIDSDSGDLIRMTIEEVLRPSDQWKAFCADDGCRYGLDGCYIKTADI